MITIYSKTNTSHGYFINHIWKDLSESKLLPGEVYSYDSHDYVVRGVEIKNCLDEKHWNHLRNDPTSKFLLFHPDEYFNFHDVNMWIQCFKEKNVPPEKIYFVVGDENWSKWLTDRLNEHGIFNFHICSLPILMARVYSQEKIPVINRFSMLSRNYQKWRTDFFVLLLKRNLLGGINYTFNNLVPYGDLPIIPHDQILSEIADLGYVVDQDVKDWIKNVPYTLKNTKITTKFSNEAYQMIGSSGINIVIESQIDPFHFFSFWKSVEREKFSPSAFITEKTFKAVACQRPFIIVSFPNFLRDFRRLGFKTFHPFINESYDQETDIKTRFNLIADEIERLQKLSDKEFFQLLEEIEPITKYNFELFNEKKKNLKMTSDFNWLSKYHNIMFLKNVDGIPG